MLALFLVWPGESLGGREAVLVAPLAASNNLANSKNPAGNHK